MLRRALQYGFTPGELREAVAIARNGFRQAAEAAPTRLSGDLAFEIADSIVENRVYTSPADYLARAGPCLDKITPDKRLAALRYAFATPGRYVMVSGDARLIAMPAQRLHRSIKGRRPCKSRRLSPKSSSHSPTWTLVRRAR